MRICGCVARPSMGRWAQCGIQINLNTFYISRLKFVLSRTLVIATFSPFAFRVSLE